ncbi:MAG: NUDIX domain-containing protein [Spirochaetales bacterium]|nr:NUDIX domain-containing protein [Spirochaetales bacterium]
MKIQHENTGEEILPIVDTSGNPIGSATRKKCHSDPSLLHPVVHLHVFDPEGRLYMQQRSMTKDLYPGFWDTAVGGHISMGESITEALVREAEEELGIKVKEPRFLFNYIWKNENETEYVHTFLMQYAGIITVNPEEIMAGNFFTSSEIGKMVSNSITTPNFTYEFNLLKKKGYI